MGGRGGQAPEKTRQGKRNGLVRQWADKLEDDIRESSYRLSELPGAAEFCQKGERITGSALIYGSLYP